MPITYRGTTLPFAKHQEGLPPMATKEIAYAAVNGIQEMPLGLRAGRIRVRGRITDLSSGFRKETIEAWTDGAVGALVIHGRTLNNVRLAGQPQFGACP